MGHKITPTDEVEALRQATREAHEAAQALKDATREARQMFDSVRLANYEMVNRTLNAQVERGVQGLEEAIIRNIQRCNDSINKRFDQISETLLGAIGGQVPSLEEVAAAVDVLNRYYAASDR